MKKISALIALTFIVFINISSSFATTFNFNLKSYILIDKNSGQVICGQNENKKEYPASTTKIITAIVALEHGKLDQEMTASRAAVNDIGYDGSNIGIMAGETYKMEDLLKALLIKSANETANILAENVCPTRQDFIVLMNKKAQELGATGTHFVNTCGIHDDNHYTTASDLSKFARYAMTLQPFRDIVSQEYLNMPTTKQHPSWPVLASTNKLLLSKSKYYTKVIGVKTGYTVEAGNNMVSDAVNDSGMELISVVMGAAQGKREAYSKELLEYGFKNFSIQNIVEAKSLIQHLKVTDSADKKGIDLVTANSFGCVLPDDKSSWDIKTSEHLQKSVIAPVKQGDILGYVQYERNGILLGKVNVIAARSVDKAFSAKFRDALKRIINSQLFRTMLIIAVILILAFFILRNVLRRISREVNSKRQEN